MADIAFLLLVFFLVTTNINQDFGIKTQISKPFGVPDSVQIVQSTVWVNSMGDYLVNETSVVKTELETHLANSFNTSPNVKNVITVKADGEVRFDDFITALDRSKKSITIFHSKLAKEQYGEAYTQLPGSLKNRLRALHRVAISEDVVD